MRTRGLTILLWTWTYWTLGMLTKVENADSRDRAVQNQQLNKSRDNPMVRMWKKSGEENREWNAWEFYSGDGPPENWDPHRRSLKIKSDIVPSSVITVNPSIATPNPKEVSTFSEDLSSISSPVAIIPALESSFIEDWSSPTSYFDQDLIRTSLPYEGPSSLFPSLEVTASFTSVPTQSSTTDLDSVTNLEVPFSSAFPTDTFNVEETDLQSSILYFSTNDFTPVLTSRTVSSFTSLYSTFIEPETVSTLNFVSSPTSVNRVENYQSFTLMPSEMEFTSTFLIPTLSLNNLPDLTTSILEPTTPFQTDSSAVSTPVSIPQIEGQTQTEKIQNSTDISSQTISENPSSEVDNVQISSEYMTPSVVIILVPTVHIVESWDLTRSVVKEETIALFETPVNDFSTATWYGLPVSSRLMVHSSDIDTPIYTENEYVPKETQEPTEADVSISALLNQSDIFHSSSVRVPRSLDRNPDLESVDIEPTQTVTTVEPSKEPKDEEPIQPAETNPNQDVLSTPQLVTTSVAPVEPEASESLEINPSVTTEQIVTIPVENSNDKPITTEEVSPTTKATTDVISDAEIPAKVTTTVIPDKDKPVETPETNNDKEVSPTPPISSTTVTPVDVPVQSPSMEIKPSATIEQVESTPINTGSKRQGIDDSDEDTEPKQTTLTSSTSPSTTETVNPTTTSETPATDEKPQEDTSKENIDRTFTSMNWETTTKTTKTEQTNLLDKSYWVRTVLVAEPQKWISYTWEDMPRRIALAYHEARKRSLGTRDRRRRTIYEDPVVNVKLVGWAVDAIHGHTDLWYTVNLNDTPVKATVASDVFKSLTKEEMEKKLGFELIIPAEPFKKETATSSMSNGRQWVILVAIAVAGFSVTILVCGALAYYRCCKKRPKTVEVDPESEPASPSYGFRNVEQALQEGTVSFNVVRASDGEGDKSKKARPDETDAKRPLPEVPGTSTATTSSGSDTDITVIKAKSRRFRTLLENEATQTEGGIVNPAFEDCSPAGTSRRKHPRKSIRANGSSVSSDSTGYFDHVSSPSSQSPHETDTLPSQAPLPPQEPKEGRRRHSNKVSASPPDVLPAEIQVQEKINELLDETLSKTAGRRLYSSARTKRIQPERGDRSQSPGFQSFRSPKHKKGSAFGDKHNTVCETLPEHDTTKEDATAPKIVWSTFKGDNPSPAIQSPTGSEDLSKQERPSSGQTEPLFQHSDKHPARQDYSGQTPITAASAPVLVDIHEKDQQGRGLDDFIGAVKVTEPAQSVIKAIRDELKKFNSSLPGTSTESNA